ncbi:unnamed protein product (macronuclear) [Paramecium tetraurelia]|uniref:Uncharacterized protein n=1 Tax=Paramecium tetraurelia TaxID=5888 RepID=A0CHW4_PARTE|nr:uncharacterized protein GSPATT00038483001 [Paramecium tetraurelia]CAK70381.1 unnamed protein product [Paramecium tetraurelia]|eukprot:XP_001437778.1 hypothetical protein (macronuclear) [Paramecium tetraurelia strain d4-2]
MLKVAVCTLFVLSITAIDIYTSVHNQKMFAQIKQSRWGSFILNFGKFHLQIGGILNTKIAKFIDELDEELAEVHHQYARRTDVHNREVGRLQQEIQDKERVQRSQFLQQYRIAAQLEQLQENIDQNRRTLNEVTVQRANDHTDFEAKVLNKMKPSVLLMNHLVYSINYHHLHQLNLKVQTNLSKSNKPSIDPALSKNSSRFLLKSLQKLTLTINELLKKSSLHSTT